MDHDFGGGFGDGEKEFLFVHLGLVIVVLAAIVAGVEAGTEVERCVYTRDFAVRDNQNTLLQHRTVSMLH